MYFLKSKNNSRKLLGISFIFLSLLFVFPQETHAQYVDVSNAAKEYVGDPLAYFAANLVLKRIANSTVNWINSGFKGNPAYVTDPTQFFLDIGDNIASDFLSGPKMNQLCTPFRAQVRLALVKNYISADNNNFSCSLSKLKDNYDAFMGDFSQGGWEGWFELTQNPGNNPYGAYLQAQSSLNRQIGIEQNKYSKQLEQGRGFLSYEKCDSNEVVTAANQAQWSAEFGKNFNVGDCAGTPKTVTPGSVIEGQLNTVLGSGENRIVAADEVDEVVGALLNQLVGRVIGGIGNGLRGASKSSQGQQSIADQLNSEPAQQPSNPNAAVVGGGVPSCSGSAGTPGTYDPSGNVIEAPEAGGFDCTVTPVTYNGPVAPNTVDSTVCQAVTEQGVINILTKYAPSALGLEQALVPLRNTYGYQVSVFGSAGDVKDKIDFGGGMTVDVIRDASGANPDWQWLLLTPCGANANNGGGGGGLSAPADALLKHPDQSGVVAGAKADLIAQGVNLSGACGAFAIVDEAAKRMGAGVLRKPAGNMCNGYATDIIAYPDGYIFDVLIDGGGANNPTWGPTPCPSSSTCPSEYRQAP